MEQNKGHTEKAERCPECGQPMDNGDHDEDGKCGFRERLTRAAVKANGGVIVMA